MKYKAGDSIEKYKARFVTKGYTHTVVVLVIALLVYVNNIIIIGKA